MSLYKNILVPILLEEDDRERVAIEAAIALRKPDGKIILMHVMEEIPASYSSSAITQALSAAISDAEIKLGEIIKTYGINAQKFVTKGHSSRAILEHAHAEDVDCIIIASHQPGLEDYLLGSTAARVVRHAKCPVHVLR